VPAAKRQAVTVATASVALLGFACLLLAGAHVRSVLLAADGCVGVVLHSDRAARPCRAGEGGECGYVCEPGNL
jgi:hypothetical protein